MYIAYVVGQVGQLEVPLEDGTGYSIDADLRVPRHRVLRSPIRTPTDGRVRDPSGASSRIDPLDASVIGLVPFRCPWHGKARLRRELPPTLCDALSYAMFCDVVAALVTGGIERTIALVHGTCGVRPALRAGAVALVQPSTCGDLTSAVRWAVSGVAGRSVMVATADLPCLRPSDVAGMLSCPEDVVVAPTQDGGTAAIKLTSTSGALLDFGGASAARHLDSARREQGNAVLLQPSDAYRDVDVYADLLAAIATGTGPATTAVLRRYASALQGACAP